MDKIKEVNDDNIRTLQVQESLDYWRITMVSLTILFLVLDKDRFSHVRFVSFCLLNRQHRSNFQVFVSRQIL